MATNTDIVTFQMQKTVDLLVAAFPTVLFANSSGVSANCFIGFDNVSIAGFAGIYVAVYFAGGVNDSTEDAVIDLNWNMNIAIRQVLALDSYQKYEKIAAALRQLTIDIRDEIHINYQPTVFAADPPKYKSTSKPKMERLYEGENSAGLEGVIELTFQMRAIETFEMYKG